jgi:hypothetical protein
MTRVAGSRTPSLRIGRVSDSPTSELTSEVIGAFFAVYNYFRPG